MPLTNNPLPAILPTRAVPLDVAMQFASNQVLTGTGFVNNANLQVPLSPGRFDGIWVLDLQTLKVTAGNETYQFALLGSNDPAFGNGNVELLAFHDFAAAAAGRVVPTICGPSPAVPIAGMSVTRHFIPFSNFMGGFVLQYLQLYAILGGTAPSAKVNSWITDRESII